MNSLITGATDRVAQACTKIPAAPVTTSAPERATPKSSAHAACHRACRCAGPPDETILWTFIHNPLGNSR